MTTLDDVFINNTHARVNFLKQAPSSWYENPSFAYIPVIGALVSPFAQFSLTTRLDELEGALKEIRMTPLALDIQRGATEYCHEINQRVNDIVRSTSTAKEERDRRFYEIRNREIAELQQKVEALQQDIPGISSTALKLIRASNHHAIVSIVQGVLLSALIISLVVLRILKPAIGVPLFMVPAVITAGHGGILARNKLEKIRRFKCYE